MHSPHYLTSHTRSNYTFSYAGVCKIGLGSFKWLLWRKYPRYCKSQHTPSLTEWKTELNTLLRMEELSAQLHNRYSHFQDTWLPWISFMEKFDFATLLSYNLNLKPIFFIYFLHTTGHLVDRLMPFFLLFTFSLCIFLYLNWSLMFRFECTLAIQF